MRRRLLALGLIPALVLIGACGSSKTEAVRSIGVGSSRGAVSTSGAGRSSGTRARAPGAAGGPPSPGVGTPRGSPSGGATHVRLPATFVIRRGGGLDPPSVTSPAFLAVDLTLVSGDGGRHRVLLRTPAVHGLMVPARGRASVLLSGLRAGRYELEVDGVARGALVIGGEPGP